MSSKNLNLETKTVCFCKKTIFAEKMLISILLVSRLRPGAGSTTGSGNLEKKTTSDGTKSTTQVCAH